MNWSKILSLAPNKTIRTLLRIASIFFWTIALLSIVFRLWNGIAPTLSLAVFLMGLANKKPRNDTPTSFISASDGTFLLQGESIFEKRKMVTRLTLNQKELIAARNDQLFWRIRLDMIASVEVDIKKIFFRKKTYALLLVRLNDGDSYSMPCQDFECAHVQEMAMIITQCILK
ncbi:hypothetical protein [Aquitalea sp. ASV11]|uniref:hypothetical protein n=1 Tax=Aquitalea sp. ASV11 TaxID=2795103 RepID=UPI0018ECC883|nr:hypothetical protein [Aquitalea sp. ASV11]